MCWWFRLFVATEGIPRMARAAKTAGASVSLWDWIVGKSLCLHCHSLAVVSG